MGFCDCLLDSLKGLVERQCLGKTLQPLAGGTWIFGNQPDEVGVDFMKRGLRGHLGFQVDQRQRGFDRGLEFDQLSRIGDDHIGAGGRLLRVGRREQGAAVVPRLRIHVLDDVGSGLEAVRRGVGSGSEGEGT